MTKLATHAAVVGEMGCITGRGQNTSTLNGDPIAADNYITGIYRRVGNEWLCMLTQLTYGRNGTDKAPPNNGMQRTALSAAAEPDRCSIRLN